MKKLLCLLSLLFVGATNAELININFDELDFNYVVGDHYETNLGVTFEDALVKFWGHLPGGTPRMTIAHTQSCYKPQPDDPIEAIFTTTVSSISLTALGFGENGAVLKAYDADGNLLGTDQAFGQYGGSGNYSTLSVAAAGIKRVEFSQILNLNNYDDGVIFDNFEFNTSASVPEPGSTTLLGLGLFGIFFLFRRKKR